MRQAIAAALALASLAACANARQENQPLVQFPGAQAQIESFYDANATEDDWFCPEVQMDTVDRSQVVRDAGGEVRMAVTYYFTSFDESVGRGADRCQGFNTRFFTFERGASGGLTLVSMSGPQRQPA